MMIYKEKKFLCWKCGHQIDSSVKVSRQDECPSCASDLRVCKNCRFWDPGYHNECRENSTYYIRDREKSNFCMAWEFKNEDGEHANEAEASRSKLEDLFKNLK